MPDQEDTNQQKDRLAALRRRLALDLDRQSLYGKAAAPSHLQIDIEDARASIAQIKSWLRGQGEPVEDLPDDDPLGAPRAQAPEPLKGSEREGDLPVQVARNYGMIQVGRKIVNNPPAKHTWLSAVILAVVILVLVVVVASLFLLRAQQPNALARMPVGLWNIAIAKMGAIDTTGVVTEDPEGEAIANRLFDLFSKHIHTTSLQKVGYITGSSEEQRQQAADIAKTTNASVVLYGFLGPAPEGSSTFTPEIFINPDLKNSSLYADEIVGSDQFGSPITYTLRTATGEFNDQMNSRIEALGHFLDGVQNYTAENFDQARNDYQAALVALGSQPDAETAAVVQEFLAAAELAAKRYDAALVHVAEAHRLWPDYPRPYLTRATILYRIANAQLPKNPRGFTINLPTAQVACFEEGQLPTSTELGYYLQAALQCNTAALVIGAQISELDLETKVALDNANIYLALSYYNGGDFWNQALRLTQQVIDTYTSADSARQARLRRVAAHAYARRGLIRHYQPGSPAELRGQAAADYQEAIRLLRTPTNDSPCIADLNRCYPSDKYYIDIYTSEYEKIGGQSLH